MPSLSPSPMKRPSVTERTSSTHSLSTSGKQATHKARPHVAGRGHGRNLSHGKNLSKLGRINSSTNVVGEGVRNHQRKQSGPLTPSTSPRVSQVKRNSSHVMLPKNTSHTNLRKNHSATALARNVSHPALKRIGLQPAPKAKGKSGHEVQFDLGEGDASEEEDAEWEDSTISPEITRNNSKASTPARVLTPNPEYPVQNPSASELPAPDKTSSPPAPSLPNNNRSLPNFKSTDLASLQPDAGEGPAFLQYNPRSSRAPPAMSTVLAHATPGHLQRNGSSRSFTHVNHDDLDAENNQAGGQSSSADGGVSHFLSTSTPASHVKLAGEEGSDYDSASNFLPNYHPQQSESPEKPKSLNKSRISLPSRTQQRQELQRREMMRAGPMTPTTPPSASMGFSFGSTVSLHSRSGSRGRNRSVAEDAKAMRTKYEAAAKQLGVVQMFRDPMLDSLRRLKEFGALPSDIGVVAAGTTKSRPQSRRGLGAHTNMPVKHSTNGSPEDRRPTPMSSRTSSRGRGGRVHFQRQGSHEDIALSRSTGSYEENENEAPDGITEEEALIRRIWESREVYDSGEGVEVR